MTESRRGRRHAFTEAEMAQLSDERSPSDMPRNTPLCGARLRQAGIPAGRPGGTCAQARGWNTSHPGYGYCVRHGGNSPQGRRFAAMERARELADKHRQDMRLFGGFLAISPEQALLEEMQRSAALVRTIEAEMARWSAVTDSTELAADDPAHATIDPAIAGYGATVTGLPELVAIHSTDRAVGFTDTEWSAWIKVLREERKHLVAVAKACLEAGVQERHQRLLEANAMFMRRVMESALKELGVSVPADQLAGVMQGAIRRVALPEGA